MLRPTLRPTIAGWQLPYLRVALILRRLEAASQAAPRGRLYHASFGKDENLQVFDIWESQESFDRVNDYFYERGWTDGLPIVPPTEERVRAMLAGMPDRDADELVSVVPPKMGRATLRQTYVVAPRRPAAFRRSYLDP